MSFVASLFGYGGNDPDAGAGPATQPLANTPDSRGLDLEYITPQIIAMG